MKSSVMMIGEFDFDNIFNTEGVEVPHVTWALFAVFVIIMTLLLMNLLVSNVLFYWDCCKPCGIDGTTKINVLSAIDNSYL